MTTDDNLKNAFAGESQANRRYLAFAKKAEADGYPQVAKLFRAAAEAETVHAHAHLRAMNGIKATTDNLEAAIAGEGFEFQEMYPEYLAAAEAEGNRGAVRSFKYALAVEEIHYGLYEEALKAVKEGHDLADAKIFVCPVCGNTVIGKVPDRCPVCNTVKDRFFEVS